MTIDVDKLESILRAEVSDRIEKKVESSPVLKGYRTQIANAATGVLAAANMIGINIAPDTFTSSPVMLTMASLMAIAVGAVAHYRSQANA